MPEVAEGVAVRWVDVAAPWLADVGRRPAPARRGSRPSSARVALRFDDDKADFVHDEEFEAVLFPLTEQVDASRPVAVDYDDRDLRSRAAAAVHATGCPTRRSSRRRSSAASSATSSTRSCAAAPSTCSPTRTLKVFGRPGETPEAFAQRCHAAADAKADDETAKLRDKYETKVQTPAAAARRRRGPCARAADPGARASATTRSSRPPAPSSTASSAATRRAAA